MDRISTTVFHIGERVRSKADSLVSGTVVKVTLTYIEAEMDDGSTETFTWNKLTNKWEWRSIPPPPQLD